jgi:hypothetical protein
MAPWPVRVGPDTDVPLESAADLLLPNPVSFIVQTLLIHEKRPPNKRAQDLLCVHDTLELLGGALEELRTVWRDQIRPSMAGNTARRAEAVARALFEGVTDTIREAARIQEARRLSPEALRAAGEYGLGEILGDQRVLQRAPVAEPDNPWPPASATRPFELRATRDRQSRAERVGPAGAILRPPRHRGSRGARPTRA